MRISKINGSQMKLKNKVKKWRKKFHFSRKKKLLNGTVLNVRVKVLFDNKKDDT